MRISLQVDKQAVQIRFVHEMGDHLHSRQGLLQSLEHPVDPHRTRIPLPGMVKVQGETHHRIPVNVRFRIGGLSLADRKSTRLNSSHVKISYAVFCLKKKT